MISAGFVLLIAIGAIWVIIALQKFITFPRAHPSVQQPGARTAAEKKTIIEEGTQFKGTLAANCAVVVRGEIEGQISGPSLEVAETGSVDGQVKVTELRSKGQLTGTFEADDVVLCGRVRDETVIIAKTLEVATARGGALVVELDDCELQIGDVPAKETALREALAGGAVIGNASSKEANATVVAVPATPAAPPPSGSAPA